jgi:exonuclease III
MTALVSLSPDLICLQEVTAATAVDILKLLAAAGFPHIIHSFAHSPPWRAVGPRRYGLVIASRFLLTFQPHSTAPPWPERLLSGFVALPTGTALLTTTHIPPGSSNGWMKVEMLEALHSVMSEPADLPRIVCGDLNAPQAELRSSEVVTWAQRITPNGPRTRHRFRGGPGSRWDAAERTVLTGTELRDAFRSIHGYEVEEFSWWLARKGETVGRRFDHAFCSPQLEVHACRYIHALRESGLSDHAPLEMFFSL